MRRVLITGGTGFIGSHLRDLLENDFEVVTVDCRKKWDGDVVLDLTCKDEVSKAIDNGLFGGKIDVVVHLASRLVGTENPNDTSVLHDNIRMAENIAYLAEVLSVDKLVHASTMAVYPNRSGTYNEESVAVTSQNAECLYGLSKICSEQLLDFFLLKHAVKTVHLRFAQVYGAGMRNDRVMSHMEQELESTNAITVFGNGERVSNFIPVKEVVASIHHFITNDSEGTFNVGGEQLSYLQLAQRIVDRKGNVESSVSAVPQGCREQVVLDCSKYQSLLKRGEVK